MNSHIQPSGEITQGGSSHVERNRDYLSLVLPELPTVPSLPRVEERVVLTAPPQEPLQGTTSLQTLVTNPAFELSAEQKKQVQALFVKPLTDDFAELSRELRQNPQYRAMTPEEGWRALESSVEKYHDSLRVTGGLPFTAKDLKGKVAELQIALYQSGYLFDLDCVDANSPNSNKALVRPAHFLFELQKEEKIKEETVPAIGGLPEGKDKVFLVNSTVCTDPLIFPSGRIMGLCVRTTPGAHWGMRMLGVYPFEYDRMREGGMSEQAFEKLKTQTAFEVRVNEAAHMHITKLYPSVFREERSRWGNHELVGRRGKSFTVLECEELYSDLCSLAASKGDYTIGRKYFTAAEKLSPRQYGFSDQFFVEAVHAVADKYGVPHQSREDHLALRSKLYRDENFRREVNEHLLREIDKFFRERIKPALDGIEGK